MSASNAERRRVQFLLPDEPQSGYVYVWRLFDGDDDTEGTPIYVGMSTVAGLDRALSHAKGALDALRGDAPDASENQIFAMELGRIIAAEALLDLEIAFESDDRDELFRYEARLIEEFGLLRSGEGSLYNLQRGKGSSRKRRISEFMSSQSAAVAETWNDPEVRAARSVRNLALVNGIAFSSFHIALVTLGIGERYGLNHISIRSDLNKQPEGTKLARWGIEIEHVPYDRELLKAHADEREAFTSEYLERLRAGEFDQAEAERPCSKNRTLPTEYV